jgi:uncharacterized membrane protein
VPADGGIVSTLASNLYPADCVRSSDQPYQITSAFHRTRSFSFFISKTFLVGMYWLQHYVMFHYVLQANRTLAVLNGLFLLSVSFLPFPTGLQAVYRGDMLAVAFFGCANIFCGLALLALWLYATGRHRLVAPEVPRRVVRSIRNSLGCTILELCMWDLSVA